MVQLIRTGMVTSRGRSDESYWNFFDKIFFFVSMESLIEDQLYVELKIRYQLTFLYGLDFEFF